MHSLGIVKWNSTRWDHPGNPGGVSGSGPVNFCCRFLFLIDLRIVLEQIFISIEEILVLYSDIQFLYCDDPTLGCWPHLF